MDHRAEKTPKKHQKMLKTSEGVHGVNKSHCVNFVHFDYSHFQNSGFISYSIPYSDIIVIKITLATEKADTLKSKNPSNDLVDLN